MNYQTIAMALRLISGGECAIEAATRQHTLNEIDGWEQLDLFAAAAPIAREQDSAATAEASGT